MQIMNTMNDITKTEEEAQTIVDEATKTAQENIAAATREQKDSIATLENEMSARHKQAFRDQRTGLEKEKEALKEAAQKEHDDVKNRSQQKKAGAVKEAVSLL